MLFIFLSFYRLNRLSYASIFLLLCITTGVLSNGVNAYADNVCTTEECIITAKEIKSSINAKIDPCENFYEFACGGWQHLHPVPPTEQQWNPFDIATLRVTVIIKDILESENGINQDDLAPLQSAKKMYEACMDNERIEETGLRPMITLTEEYGGWPMLFRYWSSKDFDWQYMLSELKHHLFYHPILNIDVSTDFKNSTQRIIYVDQPSLVVLRQMLVSPDLYERQINAYKLFIKQVAQIFLKNYQKVSDSNDIDFGMMSRITEEVDELVHFEIEMAKIMSSPEMRRDSNRIYNKMKIRDLQKWTDSATSNPRAEHSTINWLNLINMTFKHTGFNINQDEDIIVREMPYLFNLVKLLENTSVKTIANYLHWRLIEEFSSDLTSDLRKLHFQFRQTFTGATEEHPRWKECIRSTQFMFGLALGQKYTMKYFDENSKKSAVDMVNNLHETFLAQMDKVTWMDSETKEAAREKLKFMKKFIGYPDYYTNNLTYLVEHYSGLKIGKDHFLNMANSRKFFNLKNFKKLKTEVNQYEWPAHEPPVTVNAFYSPLMNAIIFPAAVLQRPFFNKGRPDALNYGAVGVIIGHEITHGFDDLGRQYDKYGNLAQWWTEDTINGHMNKSKCFVEQFNNFIVPELNEIMFEPVKINGLLTLGENMADSGGLYQAYKAYKHSKSNYKKDNIASIFKSEDDDINEFLKGMDMLNADYSKRTDEKSVPDMKLPGLEMFNDDQLFFLGFASNWCESQTKESLLHEVLSNSHSPHKYRVLGSVANSEEFAKAFNCPVGSPMNPERKCSFW